MKTDIKKLESLYTEYKKPTEVPTLQLKYLAVFGEGGPDGEKYQAAIKTLYNGIYGIKMKLKGLSVYQEFVVPPMETLWWGNPEFVQEDPSTWRWCCMIRKPQFVTPSMAAEYAPNCKSFDLQPTLGVQCLHVGLYADNSTRALIKEYMKMHGLETHPMGNGVCHEIYLSDPRRTEETKLKTIIRIPCKEEQK